MIGTRHQIRPLPSRQHWFQSRLYKTALLCIAQCTLASAWGQDRPVLDILNVESSVTTEVTPDLAVVTLSIVREGSDSASLSQDVDTGIAHALSDAKSAAGIQAATGGFNTIPRLDSKGQRVSWQVRADLILKSKEFGALGKLVGRLTTGPNALMIAGSTFEVSSELKQSEESILIEHAVAAFKNKATEATRALGYANFAIREITLGEVTSQGAPRAMMFNGASGVSSTPSSLPLEAGRVTLQLHVQGSVQMRH
jgi:predicted secreted protein